MDERDRFDALLRVLDELADANDATPILVEGRRDVETLRALGCRGRVLAIHNGQPLWSLAETVAAGDAREVILITDWDAKGRLLRDTLAANLAANGVRVDATWRDRIEDHVAIRLKEVEDLEPYVRKGLEVHHGLALEDRRGLA